MKHQTRIVLVIFIGLFLMTGVSSLMRVTAQRSDDFQAVTSPSEFDNAPHPDRIMGPTPGLDPLEIQAYLPALSTNYSPCMSSPTLLTPTNGTHLNTLVPEFWWDNGDFPNADKIRLQIATDPQMNVGVKSYTGNHPGSGLMQHMFSSNFLAGTTHYWRVYFECDGGVQSPYSGIWSFTTGSGGVILPPPALKSPGNGTVLTAHTATLEWDPVPGALEYIVSYRPTGQTWSIIQTEINPQADINNLQSATTFEWWVKVRNDYAYSENSDVWQFTTPASSATDSVLPMQ